MGFNVVLSNTKILVLSNKDLNWSFSDITSPPAVPVSTMAKNPWEQKQKGGFSVKT